MYVIHFTGELFIRDFTSLIFKPSTPHYYYVAHHVTLFIQWAPCTLSIIHTPRTPPREGYATSLNLRQWEKQGCREGYSPLSRTHVFREDYTGLYILH